MGSLENRVQEEIVKSSARNLVVISDTHSGCRMALCPREGVHLDDGGEYLPSELQLKLCDWWDEFWDKWVPAVTHGEPWDLCHNGDAVEGVHHDSVTQISHNLHDQGEIAYCLLQPVVDLCKASGGSYYHIRGTEAHVSKSGQEEERLAKRLGAVPNDYGQHARWELWKRVGGGLVHLLHHIGTTSSSAHESSAVNAELSTSYVEAGRWDHEPPDCLVRSHRHRCIEVRLPARKHGELRYASAIVTPAWQLKTPFAYKIAGARQSQPQIGGILIRQGDEELHTRMYVRDLERPRVEE